MKHFFPTDYYVVRCKEASFAPSKGKGNPQIVLKLEVVSPETKQVGPNTLTVAGTPLDYYMVTQVMDGDQVDAKKTESARDRLRGAGSEIGILQKLGIDPSSFDFENPDYKQFVGLKFWVLLKAKKTEKRKEATDEQKAAGQQGDVLIDPITGEERVQYYPNIDEVSGLFKG